MGAANVQRAWSRSRLAMARRSQAWRYNAGNRCRPSVESMAKGPDSTGAEASPVGFRQSRVLTDRRLELRMSSDVARRTGPPKFWLRICRRQAGIHFCLALQMPTKHPRHIPIQKVRTFLDRDQSSNGSFIRIVSSRSGLVDSSVTGHSISSSMRLTYLIAWAGSAAQDRLPSVDAFQPSSVS